MAIQKLGYSEQEAEFLCLAALHGGYFLRRQYNGFLGLVRGGTSERLIEKSICKGHIRAHDSANRTVIYHLGAKPFFEAIGEEDNRNRRWRQPYSVKIKLMGLDYVLTHREHHYLATETEKLNYFSGTLGIHSGCFPVRIYRSKNGRSTTARYFVDKFPLYVSSGPSAPNYVVSFCYVDGGMGKPSGFDTHLLQYRNLFAQLESFQLVYVASDEDIFPKAERIFLRLCGDGCMWANGVPVGAELHRLLAHFGARQLFERRQTASFDKRKLDQLCDELQEFRGKQYEALYRHWQQHGDTGVLALTATRKGASAAFATHRPAYDYRPFGDPLKAMLS